MIVLLFSIIIAHWAFADTSTYATAAHGPKSWVVKGRGPVGFLIPSGGLLGASLYLQRS